MDTEPTPEREARTERIRELVDELPERQQLAVSLMFFGAGSPTLESVAADMGETEYKVKRYLDDAYTLIVEALQEEDGLGPLLAADGPRVGPVLSALSVGSDEDAAGRLLSREDRVGFDGSDLGLDVGV
jgi:hypothetical protein